MISNRLKSLVKYVNVEDKVIDIGCDHALLDIYLVKKNIINNVLISDISKNALEQGIENIKKYNLESNIESRCGNGLEVLNEKDNIDTVIISGMGTNTILNILNNKYLENINKLIIQSNKDYDLLRSEVIKLGFKILEEEVIVDNDKLYINIVFIRGNKEYTTLELKYGTSTMINKEVYYKYLINKLDKIINSVSDDTLKDNLIKEKEIVNGLLDKLSFLFDNIYIFL